MPNSTFWTPRLMGTMKQFKATEKFEKGVASSSTKPRPGSKSTVASLPKLHIST